MYVQKYEGFIDEKYDDALSNSWWIIEINVKIYVICNVAICYLTWTCLIKSMPNKKKGYVCTVNCISPLYVSFFSVCRVSCGSNIQNQLYSQHRCKATEVNQSAVQSRAKDNSNNQTNMKIK